MNMRAEVTPIGPQTCIRLQYRSVWSSDCCDWRVSAPLRKRNWSLGFWRCSGCGQETPCKSSEAITLHGRRCTIQRYQKCVLIEPADAQERPFSLDPCSAALTAHERAICRRGIWVLSEPEGSLLSLLGLKTSGLASGWQREEASSRKRRCLPFLF